MSVRIVEDQAPRLIEGAVIWPAFDSEGELEIWVTPTHWEDLWLQLPEPATNEDRLAYALSMIAVVAAAIAANAAADGRRIAFVG